MPSESEWSLFEGKVVLGRFALKRKLGQGGMGVVWLAQDSLLEQPVALKFVPSVLLEDPIVYDLLRKEAQKAMQVTHPNIVRVYDFHRDATLAAISMEYVEGSTLSSLKQDRPDGVFDPGEVQKYVMQLCDALHYAHEKAKIVHRDLKPANLMIDRHGDLKVTDFGISAPITESATRISQALRGSGTLVYMSPQQIMGLPPQASDDIYAFGATLYELFTGLPPFFDGDIPTQVMRHVPPSVRVRREELGLTRGPIAPVWETVISVCLSKEASARPTSMREIANKLSYAQNLPPASPMPGPGAAPRVGPRAKPAPDEPVADGSWLDRKWLIVAVILCCVSAGIRIARHWTSTSTEPARSSGVAATPTIPPSVPEVPVVQAPTPTPEPETPPPPAAPALPPHVTLDVAADSVFPLDGEALVLIDRGAAEVVFWQAARPQEVTRSTLRGSPTCEVVVPSLKRLFLGYSDGTLTSLELSPGAKETRFARHGSVPTALADAGKYLLVADARDSTWRDHHLYNASGVVTGKTKRPVMGARYFTWNERQHRVYFLTNNVSPNDIYFADVLPNGTFGLEGDSPCHDSAGMVGPLFMFDRGRSVVLGTGRVYKATSLELELTLAAGVRFTGAVDGRVYVIADTRLRPGSLYLDDRTEMNEAVVHRYSPQFEIEKTVKLPGQPVGLGVWARGLAVATRQAKATRVFWCDADLAVRPLGGSAPN